MSQGVEPSIIDYARFYGLAWDHLEPHPLQAFTLPENLALLLEDPPELFQIDLASVKVPQERLVVDSGAASLLSSITESVKHSPLLSHDDLGIDRHRVRRMKHELPLLRSDHEIDILRFASPIVPHLEDEFLPLETVDVEEDEGVELPSSFYALPDDYANKFRSEKLEASKDDIQYLQQALKYQLEGGEHGAFEVDDITYKKRNVPGPASPPLLPLSPSPEPYVPSSDTGHLDLLSDPISPTREEVRQVERMIFANDRILPFTAEKQNERDSQNSRAFLVDQESLGDIYSPLKAIENPPSSPPTLRVRSQDLKVEVPLSPLHSDQPPPWKRKSVSFSGALLELIPELPLPIPRPENASSDDIDAFFEETIRPIAIQAERTIEQEQLQAEDTMLRVPVPIMDFSLPIAPWKAKSHGPRADNEDEALKKTLIEMKALHFSKHVWPTSGQAERELKWAPFPVELGKVETHESIPDNGFIDKYMVPPERVDVATLTWKPEGLRIFDGLAESDEKLEEGDFPEEKDINSLIRKRKLELEADDLVSPLSEVLNAAEVTPESKQDAHMAVAKAKNNARNPSRVTASKGTNEENVFANSFSATSALEDYMNVRKGRITRRKVTSDHHFAKQSPLPQSSELVDPHPRKPASQTTLQAPAPNALVLPFPKLSMPSSPHFFIISSSFLSNRRLSRHVQRFYPAAEFIERDFTLHQPQRFQKGPDASVKARPANLITMADEADMLLSPSTGLIWTTLQKIKQRSLPGQEARSAVRERILRASPRYERLLVLISQDQNSDTSFDEISPAAQFLDDNDCTAVAEFTAFCSALPDEVQATFIAGSEEELARWIVATMIKHGMNTDQDIKLLQDETLWEVFLRRAGMNAFAAQAILATLKPPDQNGLVTAGMQRTGFGLTAFVNMSVQERFAQFETLLGGRRLLGRISAALDARW